MNHLIRTSPYFRNLHNFTVLGVPMTKLLRYVGFEKLNPVVAPSVIIKML